MKKKFDISVIKDEKLLEEVSGLVEWPIALCAEFDEKFLSLPDEVLQTSMRSHQKYFSVTEKRQKISQINLYLSLIFKHQTKETLLY